MPTWLTIVIAVIGLVGSLLGLFGISAYVNERAKFKANKKSQEEEANQQEIEELKHKKYEESLRIIIREEVQPVKEDLKQDINQIKLDVAQIKTDIAANTVGEVTLLRDRMKDVRDECNDKGFATVSDKANWMELYRSYSDLGGNHFKDYVDGWKKEIEDLPTQKKPKVKKTVLVESQ